MDTRPDEVLKAEALCLLNRAVAEVRTVRVFGHLRGSSKGEFYCKPARRRVDSDGSCWEMVLEPGGEPVRLNLMPAEVAKGSYGAASHAYSVQGRWHVQGDARCARVETADAR